MTITGVREFLSIFVELRQRNSTKLPDGWKYHGLEDLLLQRGHDLTERTDAPVMPIKQCFNNTLKLVSVRDDLEYCEGYALSPGLIPVQHAWAVDELGRVVDPTWTLDRHEGAAYVGVVIDREYVFAQALRTGYAGVLTDSVGFVNPDLMMSDDHLILEPSWSPRPSSSSSSSFLSVSGLGGDASVFDR